MVKRPTALFLDVGGVLLTNGWDRSMRKRAAEAFGLDGNEVDDRHHLTFDTYELGKLTLDEYLDRMVFYKERRFSREQFKEFMFAQSNPFPQMLDLIRGLKKTYDLKIAVVSNEGRKLTTYRIQKFGLSEFVDFFIASSFVHFRKPDADIYRMALDVAQVPLDQVVYIEDRLMFVEVAQGLGIRAVHHIGFESTRASLGSFGLVLADGEG
ncbi:MAG: HAD-IA family hydrolase [Thermodesulfobacteriota bacterium]